MNYTKFGTMIVAASLAAGTFAQDTIIRDRFVAIDRDDDGVITRPELRRPLLFNALDLNDDDRITLDEAIEAIAAMRAQQQERILEGIRKRADASADTRAIDSKYAIHRDVQYIDRLGVNPNATSIDIYSPKDASKRPVMLFVHGGGWRIGDKRNVASKLPYFVGEKEMVLVSANYRLLPEGQHPENVRDIAAAIAWIHDRIAEYGGDPDRIYIMGHSAGAHLVALVATDHRRLAEYGKDLSIIKGVIVNDSQAFDLPTLIGGGRRFYARVFTDDEAAQRDASPITHVAPDKNIPSMLIIHNIENSAESRAAQAKAFQEALEAAGTKARVVAVPDRTHGELNQLMGQDGEATTKEVTKFIEGN